MCGIVGVASVEKNFDHKWLKNALAIIKHRGPDSNGIWESNDGHVVFGHVRLSIIDLTELGRQPMTICEGKISITFKHKN